MSSKIHNILVQILRIIVKCSLLCNNLLYKLPDKYFELIWLYTIDTGSRFVGLDKMKLFSNFNFFSK